MKITAIKTFLMHVGAPQPKAWASDNAYGSHTYSPGITGTRSGGVGGTGLC